MPHVYDATTKYLLDNYPADWIALAGLVAGSSIRVVDADLSTVSRAADKVLRVEAVEPYAAHFELQAGPDQGIDKRVMVYNVLVDSHLDLPVASVVFLLRPEAAAHATGRVMRRVGSSHRLEFEYKLVRVWELPVETLLSAGIGVMLLAPISAVPETELPAVIDAMQRRIAAEVPAEKASDLWTAASILMGLRYSGEMVAELLKGVRHMKESTTYQAILREGEEKGLEQGLVQGRLEEARSNLRRAATRYFGTPDAAVQARLDAISDLRRLEDLLDRVLDRAATTWTELLA